MTSPDKRPNFFQVGQPKSGTTALHEFLGQHPDVFMSARKEPLYFCDDFRKEGDAVNPPASYKFDIRAEEQYLKLFSDAGDARIRGESTTHYLYSRVAAARIHEFNPDARILVILRNPVDFLHSYFHQCVAQSLENQPTLERALQLEDDRRAGRSVPPNAYCPSFLFYRERIKYAEQLERFFSLFPPRQIKVSIFEDFRRDNRAVFRDVLEFLGVDSGFAPRMDEVNTNRSPRMGLLNDLAFNPRLRTLARRIVPRGVMESRRLKKLAKRAIWRRGPRPPMDETLRLRLIASTRPEVERCSELLRLDLIERWGY
jgi:hypothetical protein